MHRLALIGILLGMGCSHSTQPDWISEFANMEIHYVQSSGWGDTATLDIYGTGLVEAQRIPQNSRDTRVHITTFLSRDEQRRIAALCAGFSRYDSTYEPDPWYTDSLHYRITLVYEGRADTVRVYGPARAPVPGRLWTLIQFLDTLWQDSLFPLD